MVTVGLEGENRSLMSLCLTWVYENAYLKTVADRLHQQLLAPGTCPHEARRRLLRDLCELVRMGEQRRPESGLHRRMAEALPGE